MAAAKAGHPKLLKAPLPDYLSRALDLNKNFGPKKLRDFREAWFCKWEARAQELQAEERALKESMPQHLGQILESKKLLVWREILADMNYEDQGVFEEVVKGTDLLGQVPLTGLHPQTFKPASMSPQEVRRQAAHARERVLAEVRPQGSVDMEVASKTAQEVAAKWADGPYDLADLPVSASISKRFGLQQGSKTRLIDNMSGSNVNAGVQVCETPQPHSTDILACLALQCMDTFPRSDFVGRSYDLKSAYRQLGLSQEALRDSFVAFSAPAEESAQGQFGGDSQHSICLYRLLALPFGATRSVHSFLRVVHSVWAIGCCLGFLWSCYFDDFPVLARSEEAEVLTSYIPRFFELLGWLFADTGSKAIGFAKSFSSLGVQVDLAHFTSGRVEFTNTPARVEELTSAIATVLEEKTLPTKEAQRLRGRMQFASGQLFGRTSRLLLKALDEHIEAGHHRLTEEVERAMSLFSQSIRQGLPRVVGRPTGQVKYLFTDASYEATGGIPKCGVGAVLLDASGNPEAYYSYFLNQEHLARLGAETKKTIIFEAELLACIAAIILWRCRIKHRPIVAYVDNNSARDVVISGKARNSIGRRLISLLLAVEDVAGINVWVSRVPSPSNPADILSREVVPFLSTAAGPLYPTDVEKCLNNILSDG